MVNLSCCIQCLGSRVAFKLNLSLSDLDYRRPEAKGKRASAADRECPAGSDLGDLAARVERHAEHLRLDPVMVCASAAQLVQLPAGEAQRQRLGAPASE